MNAPTHLNGYPVISYVVHPNCLTVICDRQLDYPTDQRYVVATWWPELGTTWSWGHYCDTIIESGRISVDVEARNKRR